MRDEHEPDVEGTLLLGPDGSLYFIPDANLSAFRVPAEYAERIRPSLPDVEDAKGFGQPGSDRGIIVVGGAIGRRVSGVSAVVPLRLRR
jgi:hypothetical protein